jgi:glyoxylase-like metal-dependent hydrolase (beta-lactamase superfamily II)
MTGLPPDTWAVDPRAASATEVVPGIWRLRLPMPWHHVSHVNAYAVRAGDGIVLIDTGSGGHRSALAALEHALAQAGFALEDVRDLVITHFHTDHMGLAGPVQDASGCTLWGHRACEAFFAVRERSGEHHAARHADAAAEGARGALLGAVACVREELEGAEHPPRPDRFLDPGVVIEGYEVVEAPGHCPSQVCLYNRDTGVLFSADLLMPDFTTFCDVGWAPDPVKDFMDAVERVGALDARLGLAGHGRPLTDMPGLIERYRTGIPARLRTVEAALQATPTTTVEIMRAVFGAQDLVTSAAWRFLETHVYLVRLARTGRALRLDGGWRSARGVEDDLAEQLAGDHLPDALGRVAQRVGGVDGRLDP